MRLRLAMDAWCAMWFWPLTGPGKDPADQKENHPIPPSLDEWIATFEELLGFDGVRNGDGSQTMFHEAVDSFGQLAEMDDLERDFYGMRPVWKLASKHQWLGTARGIAEEQGFFHWELDFAQIFQRGGFDLQVGNPPWVRPDWLETTMLADSDPYFGLEERIPDRTFKARRTQVLDDKSALSRYIGDLVSWSGTATHLGSAVEHPVLRGVRTNLYTNFIERVWRSSGGRGVAGLIHPETHFTDPKAGHLRAAAYPRLRRHWQFSNHLLLFNEIAQVTYFGVSIYGAPRVVNFLNSFGLVDPAVIDSSLAAGEPAGEVPGSQYPWGGWDLRPHASRITTIDDVVLGDWALLFDPPATPARHARLVRPLTREHIGILSTFAHQSLRLADVGYRWSSIWNEKIAKEDGFIEWRTEYPSGWEDVVYQGPHFTVATPFAKEPNEQCKSKGDYSTWNLSELVEWVIPRTNYQRACERGSYDAAIPQWGDRPATDYWRIAWRSMTQPALERSLHAALIPPGAAHVHTVHTCTVSTCAAPVHTGSNLSVRAGDSRNTALVAGLWASLPFDYLVKVSGMSHVHAELIDRFPAPIDHPAWPYLLLRTLRLNCLTRDYAPLWEGLHQEAFATDTWTPAFDASSDLGVAEQRWTMATPLRTEFERRAALVEIDALAALMLGLTADHLAVMFRAQFPVLRKYEYEMYFDVNGRKIAKDHHAQGVKQQKDDYKLLQAYLEGEDCGDLLDRYTPFPPDESHDKPWFYKPDREAEMRTAYADFERRLGLNG
ncbi:hypothetical protein [Rhodococcus sp. BL-253-APC-6A1W]|uniref:Eco57I restriction-modification methylase domain-containing protein n=1 Tax=Rhodococcus sp. BL-253-APC-6A1W TaxID=2725307 RepID=UPI001F10E485|nr:hypothetical protein [Rhodococcus sp. BL-253-APC-6A1W]